MDDLSSGGSDDARPGEMPSSGSATKSNESTVLDASNGNLVGDDDAAVVDNKLDPLPPDAGGSLAPNCKIVELTPTSVVSAGGGQEWRSATSAIVDDNVSAIASLSTDNRDSAQLVFSGFTGEAIPGTATIKGFMVVVDRSSGGTCIQAKGISAAIAGVARSKPVTDDWQSITFYGDFDDLWGGGPIAPADMAAVQIGLATRMVGNQQQCSSGSRDARVDAVRVRVQFCTT